MNENLPPTPLDEIERQFGLFQAQPPADLRHRVLQSVRTELRRSNAARLTWRRAITVAAAALVWLHCAWSAAQRMCVTPPDTDPSELAARARQIHDLIPELSLDESRRQALVYSAPFTPTMWNSR